MAKKKSDIKKPIKETKQINASFIEIMKASVKNAETKKAKK